jgi:hypothetical protein
MSIEKSEIKAAFVHALGCDADDDLEAAQRDVLRATGRGQAAQVMENEITKIIAKLSSDMDSDDPPFRTPEDFQKAKFYLGACLAKAATLAKTSDNLRLQMEGKVMAFEHTIKRLAKVREAEERKAQALKTTIRPDDGPDQEGVAPRPVGKHPGESIAAKRKAEAEEEAKSPPKKKKKRVAKKKKKTVGKRRSIKKTQPEE